MRAFAVLALLAFPSFALAQADFKAANAKMMKELEAQRDHARKVNTPAEWFALAEATRTPPLDIDMLPAKLRAEVERMNAKSKRIPIFREAASHLDPMALAALSANLPDPDVNAAMIRALRAAGREDEAAAECRATFARRTPADVPYVLEACKDCRTQPWSIAPGPATYSVFAQWYATAEGGSYHRGLSRGITNFEWLRRVRIHGFRQDLGDVATMQIAQHDPPGLVIGDDPAGLPAVIAASARVPFIALAPGVAHDTTASGAWNRALVAAPGPEARARLLLARAGVSKLAIVLPDEGGDRAFADALERLATNAVRVTYTAGRREHREDAARVRATGADGIVLLGPAEESADWLPFLKGGAKLFGTDELDPAGFHDPRPLEGAVLVRSRYTPADTLQWSDASAAAWIAGWAVGDAMAHGADSPGRLAKALDERAKESDAANRFLSVPPEVATIEVVRVRGGKLERLP